MKALKEKIINERNISKQMKEQAWIEKDFDKCVLIREQQQEHWDKFNFMKELDKAIERKEK